MKVGRKEIDGSAARISVAAAIAVVLAGGVFGTDDAAFHERLRESIQARASRARVARLGVPPVAGAALLGLDRMAGVSSAAGADAAARLRRTLTSERLSAIQEA